MSSLYDVSELLETYKFVIDGDGSLSVRCVICKEIMSDPYISTCGCQFCGRCLKGYIRNERKRCLCSESNLSDEYLEIEVNIFRDENTAQYIKNLVVNCPFDPCLFKAELCKIGDHIRICSMRPAICIFESMGCNDIGLRKNNVLEHITMNPVKHFQFLIDAIDNMRNDINNWKQTAETNKLEIVNLKKEVERNKVNIAHLTEENERKEILISEMTEETKGMKKELIILRQKDVEKESHSLTTLAKNIEKIEKEKKRIGNKCDQYAEEMKDMKYRLHELIPILKHDLVWILKNFSKKDGRNFSEPFYKEDYKFCLSMKIATFCLSLYLHIIPGHKDYLIEWPMKHDVTVSMINQSYLKASISWTCNYDNYKYDRSVFGNPKDASNEGIYLGYISNDDITQIPELLFGDSLMISCVID